jgi:hypothetical protein
VLKCEPAETIHKREQLVIGTGFPQAIHVMRRKMEGFEELTEIVISEQFAEYQ